MPSQRTTLPISKDLVFRRQGDFSLRWTMKDANNVAVDNSSYDFKMQLRKFPGETVVATFTTDTGEFIHGGATGAMQLAIDKDAIGDIEPGTYEYDIRETDAVGNVRYLFAGKVRVVLMVTET